MKGLRILRVSWTAKKTNEWVLNKPGVKRELLDTVKARKLAYYGHTIRKQGSCLEKEIMQGTMPGERRRGRPRTAWMDNIKTWTGLSVEESVRMSEDRQKWRKYVHGVANPWSRTAKEQEQEPVYTLVSLVLASLDLLILLLCHVLGKRLMLTVHTCRGVLSVCSYGDVAQAAVYKERFVMCETAVWFCEIRNVKEDIFFLLTLPAYAEQGLCRVSVRLSRRSTSASACGWSAAERGQQISIDSCGRRVPAVDRCLLQQVRVVSRRESRDEAQHRLVTFSYFHVPPVLVKQRRV